VFVATGAAFFIILYFVNLLKPLGNGPYLILQLVSVIVVGLGIIAWHQKIQAESALAGAMFLVVAASLFLALHILEEEWSDRHGIVGKLLPAIGKLQDRLDTLIEGQIAQQDTLETIAKQNDELLNRFAEEKGIPRRTLLGFLEKMGETQVIDDPREIEKKLGEKVDEYLALLMERTRFQHIAANRVAANYVCVTKPDDYLALRSEPSLSSARKVLIPDGTIVILLDLSGQWRRVQLLDGVTGWITGQSLCDGVPANIKIK
jgi:hypothetical protein